MLFLIRKNLAAPFVTVKLLKIRIPEKIAVITLNLEQCGFIVESCVQTMSTELQTVKTLIRLGGLMWVCSVCPDRSVRKLRIITVTEVNPIGPSVIWPYLTMSDVVKPNFLPTLSSLFCMSARKKQKTKQKTTTTKKKKTCKS